MYPQLFSAASRLGPVLSRLLARGGSFATPLWKASQIDMPEVHPSGVGPAPAPTGPHPPISGISPGYQDTPPAPAAPAAPSAPAQLPWWVNGQMPGASQGFQRPQAPAPVPAPQAASAPPAAPQSALDAAAAPVNAQQPAPQQADTSFFMRNAMMQHDPITGQLLDPSGASSVTGPDLISKMMTYLHGKASA